MRKHKISQPLCSAEQAINATNWDKNSTWEALRKKSNIKPWPESKLGKSSTTQKKSQK